MSAALMGGVAAMLAEGVPPTDQIQQLQQQLQRLQEAFDREQALHRQQLEDLRRQVEALKPNPNNAPAPTLPPPGAPRPEPPLGASTNSVAPPTAEPEKAWSPVAPITLVGNQKNYLNLSFNALMAAGATTASQDELGQLQFGGHDPKQRGFTIQNLEMVLDGAVDPYFRAQANLIYQIDPEGESTFEVEEAYAETTSLPGNLQVKAGQYMSEFGRLNPTHPHTWSFVDQPLVNGRFFGGDGLRGPGARVSWLAPTPFYSELFLGVQNSQGETAFSFRNPHPGEALFGRLAVDRQVKSLGDILVVPRYVASFDLTPSQTILAGTSAALGPNSSGEDTGTQIYGVDLFWKWKPVNAHGGFPFVSWQSEGMLRRYEAGEYTDATTGLHLPRERLIDYGAYSQVAYGFHKGWVAALRGDWVGGEHGAFEPDPARDSRWRVSPSLTWFPTEFSKLRLQYNYDDRQYAGVDHSVWLQMEFTLGAHAAHKF